VLRIYQGRLLAGAKKGDILTQILAGFVFLLSLYYFTHFAI